MNAARARIDGNASPDELLAAAKDTVVRTKNCWLATIGAAGAPNARIVSRIPGVEPDPDWTIWFLTSDSSRKVAEIRADPRVTMGFQLDIDSAYAVLAGCAEIVGARAELTSRWNAEWNGVFPGGSHDPDAVFIKVETTRIELWNLARGVTPAPFGKRAAVLTRAGSVGWVRDV